MSSATPSEASHSSVSHNIVQNQDENTNSETALVLQSDLVKEERVRHEHVLDHACSLLDSQGPGNVRIGVALSAESSLQVNTAENGKKFVPITLFKLYVDCSNVFQVSFNNLPSPTISCNVDSPHGRFHEHSQHQPVVQTTEQSEQSPRKPIPAHWLPKAASPKLATAQRAKERTLKKISDNGSPGYSKGIRTTRSSVDLGRSHGREGTTYLTKEALEAVEATMTSPGKHTGSVKFSSSASKPVWNSPTSPLRSVARQQSGCSLKMSPTKSSHHPNKSIAAGQSRVSNTDTVSATKASFCATDGSPHKPRNVNTASVSPVKPKSENQPISKAKVSLRMNVPNASTDHNKDFSELSPKATKASESNGSMGPVSSTCTSRIPRVGTTNKDQNSSRISALRRAKSAVGTMRSKAKVLIDIPVVSNEMTLSNTPMSNTSRGHSDENTHPNTIDSQHRDLDLGTKKEGYSRHIDSQDHKSVHAHFYMPNNPAGNDEIGLCQDESHPESNPVGVCGYSGYVPSTPPFLKASRRATSNSYEKVSRDGADPTLTDSAIFYSLRKTDDFDNTLIDTASNNAASTASEYAHVGESAESTHATSEGGPSEPGNQVENEHQTHTSLCSDLRPTATEFVPKMMLTSGSTEPATEPEALASLQDVAGLPDMTLLDRHGIPFLWYMYGIQFAYEQGFRNGRPKSPRKFKPKKQRGPALSSSDAPHAISHDSPAIMMTRLDPVSTPAKQEVPSAELVLRPTVPAHDPCPVYNQELIQPNSHDDGPVHKAYGAVTHQPFARQFDKIAEYTDIRSNNTPRHYNIDFTKIQNAGFPTGPRSMQDHMYHKPSRYDYRNHRRLGNGLYGGRGNAAGIPIGATAPFPSPVPPQGRPDQTHNHSGGVSDYTECSIGTEACGMVDIVSATELIGGRPCNACDPGH
ncbi:hypothetical protein COCC4DRAFT_123083 [Bipolaris maydis ATCC 48331]|uniref:Uncharacterized protein n=2 Tax=Cochliobolus heterostrophus TaxID=5016 RepID=M2V7E5_COCH5|nr:uncharacterized protein COCC4DRAFT_123083 [Bipolaris maydis ATCC 48331]EMD95668.1 hypothetical protein COCHEDRAFT_1151772 [Bipolaris maydis C5]KAJ5030403.1 hypothetical protein J3E73DRAFT_388109 [Bipolaris maydis]ENI10528.1 hypothetical protein COCC4DRAFT_123083 [Bipolaris maydis ATCC 48331]KAJ6213531.1 hypothetical protein PSV09DRAFT_1151772 [Bipolaris maydis]KAJ6274755.1 hypothetical protein PSV08DRAFT_172145 [Bipolaris maydis]